jgi:hypothetical protein
MAWFEDVCSMNTLAASMCIGEVERRLDLARNLSFSVDQTSSTSFPVFDLETQGVIKQLPARSVAESTESR